MLLLVFDRFSEQHVVDAPLEGLRQRGIGAVARQAVQLRLDLSRMRREQQDAAADLDCLGDGMGEAKCKPAQIL